MAYGIVDLSSNDLHERISPRIHFGVKSAIKRGEAISFQSYGLLTCVNRCVCLVAISKVWLRASYGLFIVLPPLGYLANDTTICHVPPQSPTIHSATRSWGSCVSLLLFYVLLTYVVISERVTTWDSVHPWQLYSTALLGNQATSTMTTIAEDGIFVISWRDGNEFLPITVVLSHTVPLSWHWDNQFLYYENIAQEWSVLVRKYVYIYRWLPSLNHAHPCLLPPHQNSNCVHLMDAT